MFQLLESRRFCAVDIFVDDGVLIVRGGDSDDEITITRADTFTTLNVLITSDSGSYLEPRPFAGVTRGIFIDMGGGNDTVTFQGARVFGTVEINGGDGNDQLVVRSTRPSGHLIWHGGAGEDGVLIRKSTIQRDLLLDGGAGKDRTHLSFVHAREHVSLCDTSGPSVIIFSRLSLDGDAAIGTGASLDRLTLHDSTFKQDATITASRGDDAIRVRGTIFRQTPLLDAGAGDNRIDREIILEWNFNDGAQGWEAGFADYPAGQVVATGPDGRPIVAEDNFELASGVEELPGQLGAHGTGFKLSGRNLSDSLLMYFSKELGTAAGLLPDHAYKLSYDVKYATDLPAYAQFSFPNYLKVGGLSRRPALVPDPRDLENPRPGSLITYRLNADVGEQSTSGESASVAGFMHNDRPGELRTWASTRRAHEHPNLIRPDSLGRLWLLVGNESAFESTTTLFVQTIKVELTPATAP